MALSAYVAVAGGGANFRIAFKATRSDGATGVYLTTGPGRSPESFVTAVDTTTSGTGLDPAAPEGSMVTEIGLERDGLRGEWLAVTAKMGSEENRMAGVCAARVRWP